MRSAAAPIVVPAAIWGLTMARAQGLIAVMVEVGAGQCRV